MRRISTVLALIAIVALTGSAARAEYKKTKVAVIDFQLHGEGYETVDVGKFVAEWLITALVRDGRFEVIERRLLEKILSEQKLSLSGILDESSASKVGQMLGAKVVISGAVLALKGRYEVNARIIDVQTGSVIAAENSKSGSSEGLEDMVFQLAQAIIRDFPLEGYVVRRSGKDVIIDLGKTSGLRPGMRFIVFKEGEVVKHPKTGEVLDVLLKETGRIEVVNVMDKTSDAVVVSESGTIPIDYGQMVKSVAVADAPQPQPQPPQPPQPQPTSTRSEIDEKYAALGGTAGFLRQPSGPESICPDGAGRYRHFDNGSIYWSPKTGAHEVHGRIRDAWADLGGERGFLGYPLTDETPPPDSFGRYNHFQNGSIYWTPQTGAHEVHGDIRDKWAALGWERGFLGYPLTDETTTPDSFGRYNHFQNGSIYWTPKTGAHEVHGDIRDKWAALGWERSPLGYPVTDEEQSSGGWDRQSRFEHGIIRWSPGRGAVVFADR